ncbi:SAV_915 family protein [Acrocarpospora catenulata]|uniref:SAV_915 family protein n=1 Tax=Acrocarpospora catenulata TaxID=2836182 RepID=UPI001BDB18CB|nr:SAV_915 family protein [Acrocarpospora catenulata]
MSDQPLFVPVKQGTVSASLRIFRTPSGARTAVAFSSPMRLATVLGADQHSVRLSEAALRGMLRELGITGIVVDPAGTMTATTVGAA